MSLQAFQRLQTTLLLDRERAASMARGEFGPLGDQLTALERRRLVSQAQDPGMRLTRTLHHGWRFTKLVTLLPLTFRVGDADLLAERVQSFWRSTRPQGLYFEAEAARFAIFLLRRDADPVLVDAASVEGAMLVLGLTEHSRPGGSVVIHLDHHPQDLVDAGRTAVPRAYDVALVADPSGPRVAALPCDGRCGLNGAGRTAEVLEGALG